MLSPLRYPGGKAQYIELIEGYFNQAKHNRYIEPFAGGAAVALHFAICRNIPVIINDFDPAIYAFWRCVFEDHEGLIRKIEKVAVNIKQWKKYKEIHQNKNEADWESLGFATFFLNRCNFSGCLKSNPIGGINQSGAWKIGARFNKEALISKIEKIAQYRHLIQLTNLDAVELLGSVVDAKDFVYLDPPYYEAGRHLYSNYLGGDGHERLAGALEKTSATWLMSYDQHPIIEQMYKKYLVTRESKINYSFLKKVKKDELLIFHKPEIAQAALA